MILELNTPPPANRAQTATAAAEAAQEAGDHRTAQAYRAAASAWERLARPRPAGWSNEPARQQLRQLKRELAVSTGPFQPPAPPKTPPPAAIHRPDSARIQRQLDEIGAQMRREAAIEF